MTGWFLFAGRKREAQQLATLYRERKHLLLVGPAGIGKTALLRHVRQSAPFLHCEDSSSLRRICEGIERQLGWARYKLNFIERKPKQVGENVRNNICKSDPSRPAFRAGCRFARSRSSRCGQ